MKFQTADPSLHGSPAPTGAGGTLASLRAAINAPYGLSAHNDRKL
jgi:hypothetical protein